MAGAKSKKKKAKGASGQVDGAEEGGEVTGDVLNGSSSKAVTSTKPVKKGNSKLEQTMPPSIPIRDLYPNGDFPIGQIMEHPKFKDEDG